jgi:hypothetical protein
LLHAASSFAHHPLVGTDKASATGTQNHGQPDQITATEPNISPVRIGHTSLNIKNRDAWKPAKTADGNHALKEGTLLLGWNLSMERKTVSIPIGQQRRLRQSGIRLCWHFGR